MIPTIKPDKDKGEQYVMSLKSSRESPDFISIPQLYTKFVILVH